EFDDINQITLLENMKEVIEDNEACVLDPQFKKLRFTSETINIQIYEELRGIYNEEKENQMANESESFFALPSEFCLRYRND
ncbi:11040_t:CDS:2, partial [Funneliformis geosporum]